MGFWKSLFSTSDTPPTPKTVQMEGYSNEGAGDRASSRIFFSTDREIDLYELEELCDAVGWSRRPLRKVKKAIQHSFLVVSMWEQRGAQRRLIGFSRATSDHAFNATIWDVVIHPDYQGAGLGRKLVQTVLSHPKISRVERVYLMTTNQQVFYERIGFEPNSSTTMVLHNQPLDASCPRLSAEILK